jgi:hypothetical protein
MGHAVTWVLFPTREAFDTYHLAACAEHEIPRPGKLESDDTVMIHHTWTDAWVGITGAFAAFPGSFLLVNVPDEDVVTYGLTVAPNPPRLPNIEDSSPATIFYNGADRRIFNVAADWMQPIPPTWTDPDTGIVYDTSGVKL